MDDPFPMIFLVMLLVPIAAGLGTIVTLLAAAGMRALAQGLGVEG